MGIRLSNYLRLLFMLLTLGSADRPSIAEPEPRRLLDKDHLKGDFGPHPYPPGAGRPLEPGEKGPFRNEQGHYSLILPKDNAAHSAELQRSMMQTFGLPKIKGATDINHLRKAKDGRWLFKSIEDEKLFLLLPREKVKGLLGVPRKDTGGLIEYNCRLADSPGYLELFIRDEQVRSSKIWIEETYRQSKRK